MQSLDDLIGTAEAARILQTSTRTVHRRVYDGTLKIALKVSGGQGVWLFNRADVEALKAAA